MKLDWSGSYCGEPPLLQMLWTRWMFDPALWLGVAVAVAWLLSRQVDPRRRLASVMAGMTFALAFASPLCAAGVALFSARTLHHGWIIAVSAPLLSWGLPRWRKVDPLVAAAVFSIVLLAWHVPAFYDATLQHVGVHWVMQLAMLVSASLWWVAMLDGRARPGRRLLGLATTALPMGLLGALLTFSTAPWFDSHLQAAAGMGLSPLDDQRLGGLLMWLFGMFPVVLAMGLVARQQWMRGEAITAREAG